MSYNHAIETGLPPWPRSQKGLSRAQQAAILDALSAGESAEIAARRYRVSKTAIWRAAKIERERREAARETGRGE